MIVAQAVRLIGTPFNKELSTMLVLLLATALALTSQLPQQATAAGAGRAQAQ